MKHNKLLHFSIIFIFVGLYLLVATISMINSVDFFKLAHSEKLSWYLAIGFEMGAAASLAAIIILDKTNKTMVWGLFILLTLFQMMANSYHAYVNLNNYQGWIELFGLTELEEILQKRILSIVSGAILPIIALGFIKSLVDYIKPSQETQTELSKPVSEPISDSKQDQDLISDTKDAEEHNLTNIVAESDSNISKDDLIVNDLKREEPALPQDQNKINVNLDENIQFNENNEINDNQETDIKINNSNGDTEDVGVIKPETLNKPDQMKRPAPPEPKFNSSSKVDPANHAKYLTRVLGKQQ